MEESTPVISTAFTAAGNLDFSFAWRSAGFSRSFSSESDRLWATLWFEREREREKTKKGKRGAKNQREEKEKEGGGVSTNKGMLIHSPRLHAVLSNTAGSFESIFLRMMTLRRGSGSTLSEVRL